MVVVGFSFFVFVFVFVFFRKLVYFYLWGGGQQI